MISDILGNADDTVNQIQRKTSTVTFGNRTRHLILVLSIIALSLIYSNTLALNFTVICMVDETPVETITANGTHINVTATPMFTSTERDVLFSAVAVGMLIGSLAITHLVARFGFRKVFVLFGLLSAFATLATPLAAFSRIITVLAVIRAFQGAAISASTVALGAISAEWSTMKATGTFIASLSCHFQLGPVFTMPLAGAMCQTWGWAWLYYIQGSVSLAVVLLFFYFYRDSPRFQRHVSTHELSTIEKGKLHIMTTKSQRQIIPYRAILSDLFTWGFLGTMGAGIMSINLISQFGPVYLNKVLGMDVKNTGLMAALPFALSIVVKLTAGPLSDRLTCINERTRIIMFASVSQFLMAACYIALAFLPVDYLGIIQLIFTLTVMFSGLNAVGAVKGAHLVTQQFCHVLMAWAGLHNSASTLILPVLVSWLAPDNTAEEWGRLFLLISGIVVVMNIFFILTYSGEARPYVTAPSSQRSPEKNTKNKF